MKKIYFKAVLICFLQILFFISCNISNSSKDYTLYVNPLIGTTGDNPTQYGGTIPAVLTPFGMTHWTAMTRQNKIGACPYHYDDTAIIGFIGTHQPAVWMGDYGQISFMPQTKLNTNINTRGINYEHQNEYSKPDHYNVILDNEISVDFSATTRCGIFQVNFPVKEQSFIVIDASRDENKKGFIKIIPEKKQIVGYNSDRHSASLNKLKLPNFRGYFVFQFNNDFESYGVFKNDTVLFPSKKEMEASKAGAYVNFKDRKLSFSIATSFISIEQAHNNLKKEIKNKSYKKIKELLKNKWNNHLSRIEVKSEDTNRLTIFYTALYRTFMLPRIFSEYGRYYSAFDDKIHNGVSYNDYSLWDTYRTLHPLLLFTAPERVDDMIQSLIQMYEEGGWLPKWPNPSYTNIMIGTHADAVITDAHIKGFRDFDAEKAYEAMYKNAMSPPEDDTINNWHDRMQNTPYEARGGLFWYKDLGYVPCDKTRESVSRTIEFAYDDYCVAQMAKKLNKNKNYKFFLERSKNYQNLFNHKRKMFAPKLANGKWCKDTFITYMPRWKSYKAIGFTEGSPYTYLFGAMHDIHGLIKLIGGKNIFKNKLNYIFDSNYYKHDNEPCHHYIYLYNYVDEYDKTKKLIKKHIQLNYKNTPAGLSGNEDCGQMSAWLVMSSLGFYPMPPGSDQYALGILQFDSIILKKPNGNNLFIIKKKSSPDNNYIVKLNNKTINQPFITHKEILNTDSIIFFDR